MNQDQTIITDNSNLTKSSSIMVIITLMLLIIKFIKQYYDSKHNHNNLNTIHNKVDKLDTFINNNLIDFTNNNSNNIVNNLFTYMKSSIDEIKLVVNSQ